MLRKKAREDIDKHWAALVKDDKALSSFHYELDLHKKILQWIQPGESYYFFFSPVTRDIEIHNAAMSTILGYPQEELSIDLLLQIIHPDDYLRFMDFERTVVAFKKSLPIHKLDKYKSQYSYRVRKANDEYIHVLHQSVTIQIDEDGSIIRNLIIHTDISNIKDSNKMSLSFIGLDGEPSFHNVNVQSEYLDKKETLTKREKEILMHFSQCLTTEQIAERLFLSPFTVTTHRKNILRKTNTKNMMEALQYCIQKGWI